MSNSHKKLSKIVENCETLTVISLIISSFSLIILQKHFYTITITLLPVKLQLL